MWRSLKTASEAYSVCAPTLFLEPKTTRWHGFASFTDLEGGMQNSSLHQNVSGGGCWGGQ